MAKIGKSAGLGAPKPSSEEESLWRKFTLALVDGNADNWFSELEPRPISNLFPSQTEDGIPHLLSYAVQNDLALVGDMQVRYEDYSKPLEIPETKIGKAVVDFLESKGVSMAFRTLWPLTHETSVELPLKTRLDGQWGTESGTPFMQSFEVRTDENGREVGFWFVNLLVSPVALEDFNHFEETGEDGLTEFYAVPDSVLDAGGWTIGQLSTMIHIPLFAKQLAYMSETPFPSTQLMQMSRDIAFSETPDKSRPKPFFSHVKHEFVQGISKSMTRDQGKGSNVYEGTIFPEVIQFGWRLEVDSLQHLDALMPVVLDGCTYAMSTVEDGFENYRDLNYPAPWDDLVASPLARLAGYESRGSRLSAPQWIPVTHIGDISSQTKLIYAEAERLDQLGKRDEALEKLNFVVRDGAGPFLVHAINSLFYSYLLPGLMDEPDGIGEVEFLASQALDMEMHEQSTNALCNLGIGYFVIGDLESAERTLKAALDRPDKFAEDEASYFLALVSEAQGREVQASDYRERCENAGGYEPPSWLGLPGKSSSSEIGGNAAPPRASFCSECGTKFISDEAKFCANCGEQRLG